MRNSDTRDARTPLWVGGGLLIVGMLVLVGYAVYYLSRDFFGSPDVPVAVQIAVPAIVVGAIILLAAAIADRVRRRKRERFEEVDY